MRAPFPSASDFALSQLLFIIDAYEVLATLKKWSTRDDKLVADEERELAKKLYDDFARFTTLDVLEAAVVKQTGSDSILNLGRHGDMSSGRYISVFSLELHGGGDRTTLSVQVPRVDMSGPANKPSGDNGGPPGAAPANNTGTACESNKTPP